MQTNCRTTYSVCIKDCVKIKIWFENISQTFSLMQALLGIFSSFDLRDDKHMLYQINFYTYVCVCVLCTSSAYVCCFIIIYPTETIFCQDGNYKL